MMSGEPQRASRRPRKLAGFDEWTMEAWEIHQAHGRAWRNVWVASLGALAVALLWAYTAVMARLLEAGQFNPLLEDGPLGTLFNLFWVALYRIQGMASLHTGFAFLLASFVALGIRGLHAHRAAALRYRQLDPAQRRAMHRRSWALLLSEAWGSPGAERLAMAAADVDRAANTPRTDARPARSVAGWAIRLVLIAFAASIVALVYKALTT